MRPRDLVGIGILTSARMASGLRRGRSIVRLDSASTHPVISVFMAAVTPYMASTGDPPGADAPVAGTVTVVVGTATLVVGILALEEDAADGTDAPAEVFMKLVVQVAALMAVAAITGEDIINVPSDERGMGWPEVAQLPAGCTSSRHSQRLTLY